MLVGWSFHRFASRIIKDTRNSTRKIVNNIRAIPTAVPARPVNPSTPAINATIKKISVQPNINLVVTGCLFICATSRLHLQSHAL